MGVQQPGNAPGPSAQQMERQLQLAVNEALKLLDASKPTNPASQAEVDSLRSVIWSELTGLEAEFGREGGPRADRVERFFHHLLSSGDYIGQIESLGSALLGGEPPPTQPSPESPVAGLHRLHISLASLRQQWQQASNPPATQPPAPASASNGHNPAGPGVFAEKPVLPTSARPVPGDDFVNRERRITTPRPQPQPAPKPGRFEQLFTDLGLGNTNTPLAPGEMEPPRPRAIISFVSVFLVLALLGLGVIYWGLSGSPSSNANGVALATGTARVSTVAPGTPSPSATLNPAAAQLQVQGDGLQVPCPGNSQTTGFIIENVGGQVLSWSAKVNLVVGVAPVSLSPASGQLFGGSGTNTTVVTITAQVNTRTAGTITITSNGGSQTVHYQIIPC